MNFNLDVREGLNKLLLKSDSFWSEYVLKKDTLYPKLTEAIKSEIIKESMKEAEKAKKLLIADKGYNTVEEYIKGYGLNIVEKEEELEDYLYLAIYSPQEKTVYINTSLISYIKTYIEKNSLEDIIDREKLLDVALAHELFHHLEERNPSMYTMTAGVDRKLFKVINLRRRIQASSEIGAIYFSKLMTGISYSPCIYELILLLSKDTKENYKEILNL